MRVKQKAPSICDPGGISTSILLGQGFEKVRLAGGGWPIDDKKSEGGQEEILPFC